MTFRFAALVLALVALGAAAAAAPIVARDAVDPGRLQLTIPSAAGESEYIVVQANGASARLVPNPDAAPPGTAWTVTAPDCSQDPATKTVICTAPVTSLLVFGGDGDEGVDAHKVPFGVVGSAGGGDDYLGGGLADDTLDGGPGSDLIKGDQGADTLLGGLDDDELFGGPGSDRLVGSDGRDRMFGEGNVDRLSARDGSADGRLDCGPGSNQREKAKVDEFDPRPKSC